MGRGVRDAWFRPPRPSRVAAIAAVAFALLAVWSLFRYGPAISIGLFGVAVYFGAEFTGKQRVAGWLRVIGALVAASAPFVL